MNQDRLAPALPPRPSASTPSTPPSALPLLRPSPLLVQPQMHGHIMHKLAENLPPLTLRLHPEVPIYQKRLTVLNYLTPLSHLLPAKACPTAKSMTQTTNLVTCTILILTKHYEIYDVNITH